MDGGFHATGSVTNSGSIGPGNADGIAFLVEAGAEIDGLLANTSLASITAVDSVSNANATATAVHINGAVNTVSNAGTISAASNSLVNTGGQFTVAAHGVAHNGDAAVTPEVSLVNDGDVLVTADFQAVVANSVVRVDVIARGLNQELTGNGAEFVSAFW